MFKGQKGKEKSQVCGFNGGRISDPSGGSQAPDQRAFRRGVQRHLEKLAELSFVSAIVDRVKLSKASQAVPRCLRRPGRPITSPRQPFSSDGRSSVQGAARQSEDPTRGVLKILRRETGPECWPTPSVFRSNQG